MNAIRPSTMVAPTLPMRDTAETTKEAVALGVAEAAAATTEAVGRSIVNNTKLTIQAVSYFARTTDAQIHRENQFLFGQITDVAKIVHATALNFDSFQQEFSLQRPSTVITPVGVLVPDA